MYAFLQIFSNRFQIQPRHLHGDEIGILNVGFVDILDSEILHAARALFYVEQSIFYKSAQKNKIRTDFEWSLIRKYFIIPRVRLDTALLAFIMFQL